jgi:hypothetical protein
MKAATEVALGMRAHTGWATLVAVAGPPGSPRILYRSRLELCDGAFPRFVYHNAQAAPIEEARKLTAMAENLSRKAAEHGIRDALNKLSAEGSRVSAAMVLVSQCKAPPPLEIILASHALIHAAEGALFRGALVAGCESCKIPVRTVPERELWQAAEKALRQKQPSLEDRLAELGRTAGRPWAQDQKLAALAALIALASR